MSARTPEPDERVVCVLFSLVDEEMTLLMALAALPSGPIGAGPLVTFDAAEVALAVVYNVMGDVAKDDQKNFSMRVVETSPREIFGLLTNLATQLSTPEVRLAGRVLVDSPAARALYAGAAPVADLLAVRGEA